MSKTKTKMKSRPQVYPQRPFHIIRAISFICSGIASGILIYFCIQLRQDGFKLPWTFVLVLASTLSSLLTLVLTSIIYSCAYLSPLFNLITNLLILTIWTVALALLTWNMYGTLGHSCSRANWASDAGMMVCRTYKALYSFTVFGWVAQVAQIVLDVRSRRAETALGRYDMMMADSRDSTLQLQQLRDFKVGDHLRGDSRSSNGDGDIANSNTNSNFNSGFLPGGGGGGVHDGLGHGHGHGHGDDVPYGLHDYRANAEGRRHPAFRERARERETQPLNNNVYNYNYKNNNTNYTTGRRPPGQPFSSPEYGRTAAPAIRMDDFNYSQAQNQNHNRYAAHTGYKNDGYGYGYGYGPQR
ncbi:hypothetical protein A1O1_04392 [Capronia coronata CBS 617.96]|uniref:MARVEL domain-containing protein n=1 Tax=Capronia coronata CBS 617.96 TaxID=1182541 RepID=W9YEI0_9EURO|nr:uncharacterized protein A1O1_04392 [Capronia coronata CBS 617.96]EXJ91282.1 hypothetical protein A1O1_04392 [Capronia coronata CBS 617.96]